MNLIKNLQLIEDLAEVDADARALLDNIERALAPRLKSFATYKDIKLFKMHCPLPLCKCGKPGRIIFPGKEIRELGRIGEYPDVTSYTPGEILCSECATKRSDIEDANIPFEIWIATKTKRNSVKKGKGASIPDCYRQLGTYALEHQATVFRKNQSGTRLWYESEDGTRAFFLRIFQNA